MKKAIIIMGAIATLLVAIVTAFAWYCVHQSDTLMNKNKTEAARQARWKKKAQPDADEVEFEEIPPASDNGQHKTEDTPV